MLDKQSHYNVWRIAGPMILTNLTVPLLGIVDTAVVGHLDEPYHMGAVSIGAAIFGVVYWGFGFLRMGTTGLTAQALGQGDNSEIRATLLRSVMIALGIALILLVLQTPVGWLAFQVIEGSVQVEQYGRTYFDIRIWSAPATFMNYVLLGWFLGMQNARSPLYILTFVNLINMLLDLLFVMAWGYGADGVAWASLLAEYLGLVFALLLVRKQLFTYPGAVKRELLFNRRRLKDLLSINTDIFIRNLCLMFTLAFFTAQGARFGDLVLAANAILFNMYTFMAYGLDGFAHAAEALVGKAIGSGQRREFLNTVKSAAFWSFLVSIFIAALYYFYGYWVIALMSDIEPVRQTAMVYLPWMVFLPLLSVWAFLLDGIYIGATRAREMRNSMLISTFAVFIPVWYLLLPMANHGLWLAFSLFILGRVLSMAALLKVVVRRSGMAL